MPPKKRVSEARATEDDSVLKESVDDYLLPRTMISRLAKGVLPPNTQIQKDALTAILKSTTVFVNYLANNANDTAVLGNHKTIKPEDVFLALREMEFEHMIPRVTAEQERYVDIQNTKRNDYRHKMKEDKSGPGAEGDSVAGQGEDGTEDDSGVPRVVIPASGEPATKKAKVSLSNGTAAVATSGDDEMDDEDDEMEEDRGDEDDQMDGEESDGEGEDGVEDEDEQEEFEDAVQDLDINGEDDGDTESEDDD